MRAGRLRGKLSFERRQTGTDAAGEQLDTWNLIATRWASVAPIAGREYFAASGEGATVTHQIRVRYDAVFADLGAKDRAVFGTRVFDIQSVLNIGERNRDLVLMAEELQGHV